MVITYGYVLQGRSECFAVACDDDDVGALGGQHASYGSSHPLGAASNEYRLIVQLAFCFFA